MKKKKMTKKMMRKNFKKRMQKWKFKIMRKQKFILNKYLNKILLINKLVQMMLFKFRYKIKIIYMIRLIQLIKS